MTVARDARSDLLMPSIEPGQVVPVFRIARDDGNEMIAHFPGHLQEFVTLMSRKTSTRCGLSARCWLLGMRLERTNILGISRKQKSFGTCETASLTGTSFGSRIE